MSNAAQPSRGKNVHISTHPCVQAKLSQLRLRSTFSPDTKSLIHEMTLMIGCEALAASLRTVANGTVSLTSTHAVPSHRQSPRLKLPQDHSPLNHPFAVQTITPNNLTLVPILRSGLSMVDALTSLLPDPVSTHHLGLYREKTTLQPVEYYNNLPYRQSIVQPHSSIADTSSSAMPDLAIILDPIIATGSTMAAAIETLREWGVKRILCLSILACDGGLAKAAETWAEGTEFWVAGTDPEVDGQGMLKPGVGDIGDRLFLAKGR